MKKEGYVVVFLAVIFLFIFGPTVSPPCGEYIRIDKSSYCIGDAIRITFYMPGTGSVTIWDHTTDGQTNVIFHREQEGKESSYISFIGKVEGPPGTESLEYEVYEGCWPKPCFGLSWATDSVTFSVKDCDPCRNVVCENRCYGCDYWAMECDDGDCVKDYIIEEDSKRCGCGDPCKGKECPPECYGCDYWAMECDDGDCVKDYIIEEDSQRCGCGDSCRNISCPDTRCYGCDLWKMKCEDGECVKDYLKETSSRECGSGCGEEERTEKPEFRIVFVPGGWEGNPEYLSEAKDQYELFVEQSHIEDYLTPKYDSWDKADMGLIKCPPGIWELLYHMKFVIFRSTKGVPEGDIYVVLINADMCCNHTAGYRMPFSNIAYCSTREKSVVAHEIGHILDLDDHGGCIMSDRGNKYCDACSRKLKEEFQKIAEKKKKRSTGFLHASHFSFLSSLDTSPILAPLLVIFISCIISIFYSFFSGGKVLDIQLKES